MKIFFSEKYHDTKNTLIYKAKCNLKLPLNYINSHALFYPTITENIVLFKKGLARPLFIFVLATENNEIV